MCPIAKQHRAPGEDPPAKRPQWISRKYRQSLASDETRNLLKRPAALGFITLWVLIEALQFLRIETTLAYALLGVVTLASIVQYVLRYRPNQVWVWVLIASSLVLFMIGSALRALLHSFGNLTPNRPWLPSVVSLSGYVLLVIVLSGILKIQEGPKANRNGAIIETLMTGVLIFGIAWAFVISPLADQNISLRVIIVLAIYPTLSAVLVSLTVRIELLLQRRLTTTDVLLLLTMCSMFIGDALYLLDEVHRINLSFGLMNLPYSVSLLTFILMTVDPTVHTLTEPSFVSRNPRLIPRLVIIGVSFLAMPILLIAPNETTFNRDILGGLAFVVALLALFRLSSALGKSDDAQRRLHYQSTHDYLTGLGNRKYLDEYISVLVDEASCHHPGIKIAIFFIDLDRFKMLNDTLGHSGGDAVLREVAQRLEASSSPSGAVFRMGGDEFVVIEKDIADAADAMTIAASITEALGRTINVHQSVYRISAAVGIEIATIDSTLDVQTLIENADLAMYEAKASSPSSIAVFTDSIRKSVEAHADLEVDLHNAVRQGELFLVYHPIVEMSSQTIVAVEALVRWRHPKHGVLAPDQFIKLAEQTGAILDIGRWVLFNAVKDLVTIRASRPALAHVRLNVNLSVEQFRRDRIDILLVAALRESCLDGEAVCVEITESSLMSDLTIADGQLQKLRSRGVRVALDDFGTEYSSLAYLRTLPVDLLKIDRSFVEALGGTVSVSDTLVMAIIAIAKGLNMDIIAEGVENIEQARRLAELGCEYMQGYLYSKPVPLEELVRLVDKRSVFNLSGGLSA